MAWKRGPVPPKTYNWGAVVPYETEKGEPWPRSAFLFADFQGDKIVCCPGDRVLKPHEVVWYDNSIELPPE